MAHPLNRRRGWQHDHQSSEALIARATALAEQVRANAAELVTVVRELRNGNGEGADGERPPP